MMIRSLHPSYDGRPRKMRWKVAAAVVLSLVTCTDRPGGTGRTEIEPWLKGLGVVPPTEVATWKKAVSSTAPKGRFLQATAFDETRRLLVMFGGQSRSPSGGTPEALQDLWEWSPAQGTWALRTTSGVVPDPRAGASMVFDSTRNKMVLFGGRSSSGYNYEDLWEWDPTTGDWTERSAAGTHPAARAQQGMVYQKGTGKILLFGGGRSSALSSDGTSVSMSFGDTWQLDPATATWTAMSPTSSPSVRHDFGLVWDSVRNKAVFFGGMQVDIAGATGVPKEDTWEWDPSLGTWTERTLAGSKPGQRYGHAMAFDSVGGKVLVFGGWDMQTTKSKNDLWSWEPVAGTWTQLLTGTESGIPAARSWASMLYDPAAARLDLMAGQILYSDVTGAYGLTGTNDVWELDPATVTFSNRSIGYKGPAARAYHVMAYDQATSRVCLFGGIDPMWKGSIAADLWQWDGATWTQVESKQNPGGRMDAAMAYDPARRSLILFGGNSWSTGMFSNDTWEWNGTTRQWTQLVTTGAPDARTGHAMVTDMARKKVLLFGGSAGVAGEVWEWDGATLTWTNRTPASSSTVPARRSYPVVSYDEHRQKMVFYEGNRGTVATQSTSAFWEWDAITGGWALRDPGDTLSTASNLVAVYDSARRRHVFLTDAVTGTNDQTWELDARSATWYVRAPANTPGSRVRTAMTYDAGRRVAVVFGGTLNAAPGGTADDTWEYSVSNLANGEGCTAASAASCASGQCVEGVCCDVAACSGACKSCNVPGSEGTCVLAQAGTEVPGSCSAGQSCDGTGACKSKNGEACTAASTCASGHCVDGVCCDLACAGTCMACNLAGRVGTCTPHTAGTDPGGECGQGTGSCKSTCDGVGACTYPLDGISCGPCLTCDGAGTCARPDPACSTGSGGVPGKGGTTGKGGTIGPGGKTGQGGAGGSSSSGSQASGGSGGSSVPSTTFPGSGGVPVSGGGSGGGLPASGGQAGSRPGTGGLAGGTGGTGGGGVVGAGGTVRDAGPGSGGVGGTATAGTLDAGRLPDVGGGGGGRDGGVSNDGGLSASLRRGGCSCDTGRSQPAAPAGALWPLLLGGAWLVRRLCKRSRT